MMNLSRSPRRGLRACAHRSRIHVPRRRRVPISRPAHRVGSRGTGAVQLSRATWRSAAMVAATSRQGRIATPARGRRRRRRRTDPCVAGPVRVVLDRADRRRDLAADVRRSAERRARHDRPRHRRPEEAVDYLFSLAREAEGRVGREAIMPAMLADAGNTSGDLLAIGTRCLAPARNTSLCALLARTDRRARGLNLAHA